MNSKLLLGIGVGTAVLIGGVGPAAAAEKPNQLLQEGWYLELSGGANFLHDVDGETVFVLEGQDIPLVANVGTNVDFEAGFMMAGAAGYKFGNGLRGELELAVRNNGVNSAVTSAGADLLTERGALTQYAVMANVYYDIKLNQSPWVPYIGAGVGVAVSDIDSTDISGASVGDKDVGFAWQVKTGVNYPIEEQWSLGFGYTFFRVESVHLEGPTRDFGPVTVTPTLVDGDALMNHTVLINARYHFPMK